MNEITQQDFYKGIFLRSVLSKLNEFNIVNISSDVDPLINGILLSELYPLLKTKADDFAAAMVQ